MAMLICGDPNECMMINKCIKSLLSDYEIVLCESSKDMLDLLAKNNFDVAMVLFDGANGMETVITLKRQCPTLPIIWLSDDIGFAAQSYRLNVAFFHEKPITQQILSNALASCKLIKM